MGNYPLIVSYVLSFGLFDCIGPDCFEKLSSVTRNYFGIHL